jgi:hypothetical protein
MTVRILRLMEYTYPDNERAERDMMRWAIPPIGGRLHGDMTIRSTILTNLNFGEDETEAKS